PPSIAHWSIAQHGPSLPESRLAASDFLFYRATASLEDRHFCSHEELCNRWSRRIHRPTSPQGHSRLGKSPRRGGRSERLGRCTRPIFIRCEVLYGDRAFRSLSRETAPRIRGPAC